MPCVLGSHAIGSAAAAMSSLQAETRKTAAPPRASASLMGQEHNLSSAWGYFGFALRPWLAVYSRGSVATSMRGHMRTRRKKLLRYRAHTLYACAACFPG